MTEFSMTQQQLAEKVGKSRAAVANTVRLTGLPSPVKQMVRDGALSEGHARAILSLDNEDAMLKMARDIVDNELSVRQIEKVSSGKKRRRLIPKKQPTLVEMENYLKRLLGTSVRINHGLKRGKIEIEYYSDDDLERLLDLMRKIEQ
jgi:ParB family chromosome partitioning protein